VRKVNELISSTVTRRNFLAGAGTAAALTAVGCNKNNFQPGTPPSQPGQTPGITDADILNFALNLEYLEASYYLIASTGKGVPAADQGNNAGVVTGGSQVPFANGFQAEYASEIAQDELNHVRFLRSALGSSAASMPAIDLVSSFNKLATAAGIGASFNPFESYENFLLGAFIFEDVGVTAYTGAATLLTNKTYLDAAAGIQAVEAYHAGEIRTLINLAGRNYVAIANQISALRATLGGGNETPLSPTSVVAADSTNAIAFSRTTDQVLQIVYGLVGGNVSSGLFFPLGLNGTIKSTTP
jgi:hypothetical protein